MVATPDGRRLAGLRVLVAEDELVIAMLLEDMLKELGADVVGPFKSAKEAVCVIGDEKPDVATLDVNLAGHLVYAAARELHARSIPFVFVSGYSELPDCPPELRNVPRLRKPFRLEELVAAIERALDQSRSI